MNTRRRKWCFTLHDYTEQDESNLAKLNVRYLIYGREICPKTNRRHLQGYIEYDSATRFKCIKRDISDRAHVEPAKGSAKQNRNYCSKDGDYYEKGEPKEQGQRTDLKGISEAIIGGKEELKSIGLRYPETYIKYHRGILAFRQLLNKDKIRNFKTMVSIGRRCAERGKLYIITPSPFISQGYCTGRTPRQW